jgi:hypothetical protein
MIWFMTMDNAEGWASNGWKDGDRKPPGWRALV